MVLLSQQLFLILTSYGLFPSFLSFTPPIFITYFQLHQRKSYAIPPLSIILIFMIFLLPFIHMDHIYPQFIRFSLIPFILVLFPYFSHPFPIKTHVLSTKTRNQVPPSSQIYFLLFIIVLTSEKLSFDFVLISDIILIILQTIQSCNLQSTFVAPFVVWCTDCSSFVLGLSHFRTDLRDSFDLLFPHYYLPLRSFVVYWFEDLFYIFSAI